MLLIGFTFHNSKEKQVNEYQITLVYKYAKVELKRKD